MRNRVSVQFASYVDKHADQTHNPQVLESFLRRKTHRFSRSQMTGFQTAVARPTLLSEKSPRRSSTLGIRTEIRLYRESLMNPDYTGNHA